jgi:D-sedoheptulose 7-phosphate isomerase
MPSPVERIRTNLDASIASKQQLLADTPALMGFARAVEMVVARYRRGGRLYIAGNGGSAADAQHLAAEFVSRLARDRAPLPAEALTTDSSILPRSATTTASRTCSRGSSSARRPTRTASSRSRPRATRPTS